MRDASHHCPDATIAIRACRNRTRDALRALSFLVTSVVIVLATVPPARTAAQGTASPTRTAAQRDAASAQLDAAYRAKAAGNLDAARDAFLRALELGADSQRVHAELGYLEQSRGNRGAARAHFEQAAHGPDQTIATSARGELRYLPTHLWGDLYVEGYGWHRVTEPASTNLVPMLRLRGLWRPVLDFDLNLYVYGQITRDVASRDRTPTSLPLVYADNHALLGGGLLLRLFGRAAIWAQAGPAFNLIDDGRERIDLDVRAGIVAGTHNDECILPNTNDVRAMVGACGEIYGEITYVSRFDHDIIGMLRGRGSFNLLMTGPVMWQPLIELRGLFGKNDNYYNNVAEVGAGHRFRLVDPFIIDLITSVHGGFYFRTQEADPVPDPPLYMELRLVLATYVELVP